MTNHSIGALDACMDPASSSEGPATRPSRWPQDAPVERVQDISRPREMNQALRTKEARYLVLVENIVDYAIVLTDAEGLITEWAPGAERMLGYASSEILGRHVGSLCTPESIAAGEPGRRLAAAADCGREESEGWRLRRDGSRFWANEIITPVRAADGALIGFTAISRDLSARHAAAERNRGAAERDRAAAERDVLRRRLIAAEDDERRRLARELHDEAGQHLAALGLGLQALSNVAAPGSEVDRRAEQLRALVTTLGQELHGVAVRLRQRALDDFGLEAALVSDAKEWSKRSGIPIDILADVKAGRLPAAVESTVYRIVQEALTNVAKHSGATRVGVVVERRGRWVHVIIEDDGSGFDPGAISPVRQPAGGLGLLGIRERVELLGGELDIESSPGGGATIFVRLPIDEPAGGPGDSGTADGQRGGR